MELASSQYRGIIILEKGGGGTQHTSIPSSLTIPHRPPCGPSLPAPTNPNILSPFRQPPSLCSLLSPSPLSKNLHFLLLIILRTDRHTLFTHCTHCMPLDENNGSAREVLEVTYSQCGPSLHPQRLVKNTVF